MQAALAALPYTLLSLRDAQLEQYSVEEKGTTYQENARLKAQAYALKGGYLTLADDAGIIVDALQGELGVKTRRWGAGESVSDQEWLDFFMKRMESEKNRKAYFVCAMSLVDQQGDILFETEGRAYGQITRRVMAPIIPGIPLSSVFLQDGCTQVYAAMHMEEKNSLSHRAQALRQVKGYLSGLQEHR